MSIFLPHEPQKVFDRITMMLNEYDSLVVWYEEDNMIHHVPIPLPEITDDKSQDPRSIDR
jgi:hypothetical protein